MINNIEILDSDKYKILNRENGIKVYNIQDGMTFQEKFYTLINVNDSIAIYEVSRDIEKEIGIFKDYKFAIGVLIVLCCKKFERPSENNEIIRKLRGYAEENNIELSCQILKKECDEKFYSIFSFKENAICLIKENDTYNIYYKSKTDEKIIISATKLSRAFVVTYNYAKMLKYYDSIYNEKISKLNLDKESYNKLLEYYVFY